jgi:hypothetical protein
MQAARSFGIHHAADLKGPLQASKSSKPVLYTHTLCPYAQRVFFVLLYKVHAQCFRKSKFSTSVFSCRQAI